MGCCKVQHNDHVNGTNYRTFEAGITVPTFGDLVNTGVRRKKNGKAKYLSKIHPTQKEAKFWHDPSGNESWA